MFLLPADFSIQWDLKCLWLSTGQLVCFQQLFVSHVTAEIQGHQQSVLYFFLAVIQVGEYFTNFCSWCTGTVLFQRNREMESRKYIFSQQSLEYNNMNHKHYPTNVWDISSKSECEQWETTWASAAYIFPERIPTCSKLIESVGGSGQKHAKAVG